MTKYFYTILSFLFLLSAPVKADAQADSQILEGLNLIYNLKFDEAESLFKSIQKANPDDLKGYFYESLIYFYKALPSRDENLYNKYIDLSEKVIQKAEDKIDKNENLPIELTKQEIYRCGNCGNFVASDGSKLNSY